MARIFGVIWTLTGIVIISVLIGQIATSLTTVTVEKEIMLYGREVSLKAYTYHEGVKENSLPVLRWHLDVTGVSDIIFY